MGKRVDDWGEKEEKIEKNVKGIKENRLMTRERERESNDQTKRKKRSEKRGIREEKVEGQIEGEVIEGGEQRIEGGNQSSNWSK